MEALEVVGIEDLRLGRYHLEGWQRQPFLLNSHNVLRRRALLGAPARRVVDLD